VKPGNYLMTWEGVTIPVTVRATRLGLMVTPPSGWDFSIDTVPTATFEEVAP
jgi:hypothetical protein